MLDAPRAAPRARLPVGDAPAPAMLGSATLRAASAATQAASLRGAARVRVASSCEPCPLAESATASRRERLWDDGSASPRLEERRQASPAWCASAGSGMEQRRARRASAAREHRPERMPSHCGAPGRSGERARGPAPGARTGRGATCALRTPERRAGCSCACAREHESVPPRSNLRARVQLVGIPEVTGCALVGADTVRYCVLAQGTAWDRMRSLTRRRPRAAPRCCAFRRAAHRRAFVKSR